jgi:hypothetical protein
MEIQKDRYNMKDKGKERKRVGGNILWLIDHSERGYEREAQREKKAKKGIKSLKYTNNKNAACVCIIQVKCIYNKDEKKG